jgi:TPP-dependent 2-oxoacid decarboxylase
MAKYATGKRSQAISDRSGMAFPYKEMVKEWNGSLVHISEFEPKHPQIRRRHNTADAIALQNSRNQKFQQPIQPFINTNTSDVTITNSGGTMVGVANLTLPGDFAFKTQDFKITRVIDGVQVTSVLHSMIPEDPSLQNRRRELLSTIGKVEVNIT